MKDQEPWMKVLQDNIDRVVTGYPYVVKFRNYLTPDMEKECDRWAVTQDIPCVSDSDRGKIYRFANLEDATLFKITFGGEFE